MAAGNPFTCDMCPPPRFGEAPKTFDAGGLAVHQGKCHNPLKRADEEEIQKFHAEGEALRAEAASAQSALKECRELAKSAAVGLSSKALMGFAHVHFDKDLFEDVPRVLVFQDSIAVEYVVERRHF
jgi:hypothetical protein